MHHYRRMLPRSDSMSDENQSIACFKTDIPFCLFKDPDVCLLVIRMLDLEPFSISYDARPVLN